MNKRTHELFEKLREKRNEIAKKNKVKPFMIFHNSVLEEIAEKKPAKPEDLIKIRGIRERKIAKHGEFVLNVVNDFLNKDTKKIAPDSSVDKIYSVGEFVDFLNQVMAPQKAVVQGEASGVSEPGRGYRFFKLLDKNEEAVLDCFIWQSTLDDLEIELKEGLEVKVAGFPEIYKKSGRFNFRAEHIGLVGEGALKLAFEALKRRLLEIGYFDPERKKPVPRYPEKIGLITSGSGDAKSDFLTHLGKFGFELYFYNVRVEGSYAIDDIVSAIRWFNENMLDIEVLVLTRGGGSLEALQAFNSKMVAKAIFSSKIPLVTGIGHENDETIADLVADFSASTPTAAARILSDHWRQALKTVSFCQKGITSSFAKEAPRVQERLSFWQGFFISRLGQILDFKRKGLDNLQAKLGFLFQVLLGKAKTEENRFKDNFNKLNQWISKIRLEIRAGQNSFTQETGRWLKWQFDFVDRIEEKLNLADPTNRLKQGYSIIFKNDKKVVKNAGQLKIGDRLNLKFYRGSADSRVERVLK